MKQMRDVGNRVACRGNRELMKQETENQVKVFGAQIWMFMCL